MKEVLAYPANYWQTMYEIWLFIAVVIYLVVFIPERIFSLNTATKRVLTKRHSMCMKAKLLKFSGL